MIYIFDIDGTIADLTHRLHFISNGQKDWDGFFAACDDDLPIETVITTARLLKKAGATILFVSGRSDVVRDKTFQWLKDFEVPFDALYMRKAGDHRQDNIVKAELLDELTKTWDTGQVIGVFEDRNQVVEMYRERRFRVFQVAAGDF